MSISVKDKQRAVLITIAACCLETVTSEEEPHTFRANKLSAAQTAISKATDDYTGGSFQGEDMKKAEQVFEVTRRAIEKLYREPKPRRVSNERRRGQDGRFLAG